MAMNSSLSIFPGAVSRVTFRNFSAVLSTEDWRR